MIRQKYFYRSILIASILALTFTLESCKKNNDSVGSLKIDIVTITGANPLMTDTDIKSGVLKTNDRVSLVQMSHREHERSDVKCITCHHKKGNDERIKKCAVCHKGQDGATVIHNLCINCHTQKKKGPVVCQDCHKIDSHK